MFILIAKQLQCEILDRLDYQQLLRKWAKWAMEVNPKYERGKSIYWDIVKLYKY